MDPCSQAGTRGFLSTQLFLIKRGGAFFLLCRRLVCFLPSTWSNCVRGRCSLHSNCYRLRFSPVPHNHHILHLLHFSPPPHFRLVNLLVPDVSARLGPDPSFFFFHPHVSLSFSRLPFPVRFLRLLHKKLVLPKRGSHFFFGLVGFPPPLGHLKNIC